LGSLLLWMAYCLWRLILNPKSRLFFVAAYVFLGLAILAKGVLAIAFWFVSCAAMGITRRHWGAIRTLRPIVGVLIALVIALPWLIAVERANPGFVQYFLFNENVKRALDTRWPPDYNISKISAWGYLLVSALWCLPWVFLLPPALRGVFLEWRRGFSVHASLVERQRSDALTLLGVLAGLPILLFLPLSSRLYYYSVPAMPPLAIAAGHWWSVAWQGKSESARIWIGWMMTGLGIAITTGLFWLPSRVIRFFPELAQTQGVQTIVTVQLIGLGVGLIGSGTFLLKKRLAIALVLLWFGFGTTWACVVQGFKTVQDFRSSKTLIFEANAHLKEHPLWIFEGSRELGAAGAMSFYLNPSGVPGVKGMKSADSILTNSSSAVLIGLSNGQSLQIPSQNGNSISADWVVTPNGTLYQTLAVLKDGGSNRLPPSFPGKPPATLITKNQMQQFWNSTRPVVFVTDFLRIPQDSYDPLTLNLPKDSGQPLLEIGPRKLYGNAIARKLWLK
jgi:4-amino-4-deoxy-L-arabinose transferase-like glycosyltransferase